MEPTDENRIVIYTAVIGGHDLLLEPACVSPGCDYICFTDNPRLRSNVWKIVHVPLWKNDSIRTGRRIKILAHRFLPPQYTYSVWADANISLKTDVRPLLEEYLRNTDIACFVHPERDCVYEEADVCAETGRDHPELIARQMRVYRAAGYPAHAGLIWSGILFRRHRAPRVRLAMEQWWKWVRRYSRRDQLSFNFVMWKLHLSYFPIRQKMMSNDIADYRLHDGNFQKLAFSRQKSMLAEWPDETDGPEKMLVSIDRQLQLFGMLALQGWALIPEQDDTVSEIDLLLQSGRRCYVFPCQKEVRPDLASYFPRDYSHSGFLVKIREQDVERGHYQIGVAVSAGGIRKRVVTDRFCDIRYGVPAAADAPAAAKLLPVTHHIDGLQMQNMQLHLEGWAFIGQRESAQGTVRLLLRSPERQYAFDLCGVVRPDVAQAFHDSRYETAGFSGDINGLALAPALYELYLLVENAGQTGMLPLGQTWDLRQPIASFPRFFSLRFR